MDVETARYLLSALIQAVAITWALIITIYAFVMGYFLRKFSDISGEEFVKLLSWGYRFNLIAMMLVSAFALATIVLGIVALTSFETDTYLSWATDWTIVFSILTFGGMFFIVLNFLIGAYMDVKRWEELALKMEKEKSPPQKSPDSKEQELKPH